VAKLNTRWTSEKLRVDLRGTKQTLTIVRTIVEEEEITSVAVAITYYRSNDSKKKKTGKSADP